MSNDDLNLIGLDEIGFHLDLTAAQPDEHSPRDIKTGPL